MTDTKGKSPLNSDNPHSPQKEWDEISCPICMEHPHNAVLLLCSSHDNGCRSYICDTSHRHSNCLDRFKKLKSSQENADKSLKCPLCRGNLTQWTVIKEARKYWDMKPRSCSRESCSFSGNYIELRKHARQAHPMTRPADADPTRRRAWRRLEHEREYGDIVSAIRSAMPGAMMFGDYAVDDDDGDDDGGGGPWWATLFLFHMMSSSHDEFRASRTRRRTSGNRYLWGENLLGLRHDDGDGDGGDDDDVMPRRTRRRLPRSRPEEEGP